MDDDSEIFLRVLEYQRLKYNLEQEGIIKPDNTKLVYSLAAFIAGSIVGSIIPW